MLNQNLYTQIADQIENKFQLDIFLTSLGNTRYSRLKRVLKRSTTKEIENSITALCNMQIRLQKSQETN